MRAPLPLSVLSLGKRIRDQFLKMLELDRARYTNELNETIETMLVALVIANCPGSFNDVVLGDFALEPDDD